MTSGISEWGTIDGTLNEPTAPGISAWGTIEGTLVDPAAVSSSAWGTIDGTLSQPRFYEWRLATDEGMVRARFLAL